MAYPQQGDDINWPRRICQKATLGKSFQISLLVNITWLCSSWGMDADCWSALMGVHVVQKLGPLRQPFFTTFIGFKEHSSKSPGRLRKAWIQWCNTMSSHWPSWNFYGLMGMEKYKVPRCHRFESRSSHKCLCYFSHLFNGFPVSPLLTI